jgi:hypothetical protein
METAVIRPCRLAGRDNPGNTSSFRLILFIAALRLLPSNPT